MTKKTRQWRLTFRKWWAVAVKAVREAFRRVYPGQRAWRGAGWGIGILGAVFWGVMAVGVVLPAGWGYFFAVVLLFPLAYGLGLALVIALVRLLLKLPALFLVLAGAGFLLAMSGLGLFDLAGMVLGGMVILVGGLLGAGVTTLLRGGWRTLTPVRKGILVAGMGLGTLGLIAGTVWLLTPGPVASLPERAATVTAVPSLADALADPALPGEYAVQTLTYGSDTDRRRPEFAEGVAFTTDSVDGSAFVKGWSRLRTALWGFDATELPLNGRVWYPEGKGPFPLVLVVHGNHLAEDFSDPGYAYLCELIASRGSICVSVDENFLNGSAVGDLMGFKGLSGENDLRGWLLLEHLSLWADLAEDPDSPFAGQVDLERIALIGHSRGGEAAAVAALFNTLPYYPDNAKIAFDYGFNIRSLVAIAPVDGQYRPASEPTQLTDVNYLVLQGTHDMDVVSFDGLNLFERLQFSGDSFYFKSAVSIWGANHGQFNTTWGDNDVGTPRIWLYDRGALIPAEDQMQVAQVMVSAFLEATLMENRDYLPLFQNVQAGRGWLPENFYANTYADSATAYLLTYEEDVDVSTGTVPDGRVTARELSTWREDRVPTKWGEMDENSAVLLGWDAADEGSRYTLRLPGDWLALSETDALVFSAAQAGGDSEEEAPLEPLDFTVELVDAHGETAALPLSAVAPLQPERPAEIRKRPFLMDMDISEPLFQTYLFELGDFLKANPAFSLADLAEIRLVFDRTEAGEIWLDNLGFRIGQK